MIAHKSEEVAEENRESFSKFLRSLPASSVGICMYRVRRVGEPDIYIDQTYYKRCHDKQAMLFYGSKDLGGYRPMSLCTVERIANAVIDEMYHDIGLGTADVMCDYKHKDCSERVWHGKLNIGARCG